MYWSQIIDYILGSGIVFLQVSALILLSVAIWGRSTNLFKHVSEYQAWYILGLSLSAILGSLFYSDIIGFTPCILCWWQRIFLYPIPFVVGYGIIKKYNHAVDSIISLAVISSGISVYHYLVQKSTTVATSINCDALGGTSCSVSEINVFGYITIPLMALTLAITIVIIAIGYRKN